MNLLTAHQQLQVLSPAFTTNEAAKQLGVSNNHAAVLLSRLAQAKTVVHLARGRWAYSDVVDPLLLINSLVFPMMAYVSLYSALYYHGMIAQIPSTIFAVSNGKTKTLTTPLAQFSIHHINPVLFSGYAPYGKQAFLMATPEKALFDVLYFRPARSNRFKRLTEIELPDAFAFEKIDAWLAKIINTSRRKSVEQGLKGLF